MLLARDDVGPGPVVVLIHGLPMDRTVWAGQVAEVGSTYRVIAPDLRGAGETAVPDGVYTVDLLADDVIDSLDALDIEEPVVVGGLSMGGFVALSLAIRHPGRVRGLILINTRAAADSPEVALKREALARAVEAAGSAEPVVDAMLAKLFAEPFYRGHPEAVSRFRHRAMRADPRGLASTLRGLAIRPDRTADLGAIVTPTLVIAGGSDAMIRAEESEAMARAIPGADLIVLPEAGHLAPIEARAEVDGAILAFLRGLPA